MQYRDEHYHKPENGPVKTLLYVISEQFSLYARGFKLAANSEGLIRSVTNGTIKSEHFYKLAFSSIAIASIVEYFLPTGGSLTDLIEVPVLSETIVFLMLLLMIFASSAVGCVPYRWVGGRAKFGQSLLANGYVVASFFFSPYFARWVVEKYCFIWRSKLNFYALIRCIQFVLLQNCQRLLRG